MIMAVIAGVAVLAAAGVLVYKFALTDKSTSPVRAYKPGSEIVLPFTGLNSPEHLAVDSAGNVYVTDDNNKRVLKLLAGSPTQSALPFTGLSQPQGVAVDSGGNVYVSDDNNNNRVLELSAGSSTPTMLPFTGLSYPDGVAVDSSATVYIVDGNQGVVLRLSAGSSTQTVLPFTGLASPRVWRWTPPAASTSPTSTGKSETGF
jgi:serine/threonine-protein kinase